MFVSRKRAALQQSAVSVVVCLHPFRYLDLLNTLKRLYFWVRSHAMCRYSINSSSLDLFRALNLALLSLVDSHRILLKKSMCGNYPQSIRHICLSSLDEMKQTLILLFFVVFLDRGGGVRCGGHVGGVPFRCYVVHAPPPACCLYVCNKVRVKLK